MSYRDESCRIEKICRLTQRVYSFVLCSPFMAQNAIPGQFVHIRCEGFTLRRPISICEINPEDQTITLVFEVRGGGTQWLSERKQGEGLTVLGPLGNGFCLSNGPQKAVFVGGGIGTPPLLQAVRFYGEKAVVLLGFQNKEAVVLEEEFKATGAAVYVATDDGSYGHKGFVTDLLQLYAPDADILFACGPKVMLKKVQRYALEMNKSCQISLEERMACGIGACLGCNCAILRNGKKQYLHVCKDGPVFEAREVVFDD